MSSEENSFFSHLESEDNSSLDMTTLDHLLLVGVGVIPFVIATIHHYITF